MATKVVKRYDWVFAWQEWADALRAALKDFTKEELAEIMEVHSHTILSWSGDEPHNDDTPYPSMTNFIKVCNMLDLDPRKFWYIK